MQVHKTVTFKNKIEQKLDTNGNCAFGSVTTSVEENGKITYTTLVKFRIYGTIIDFNIHAGHENNVAIFLEYLAATIRSTVAEAKNG